MSGEPVTGSLFFYAPNKGAAAFFTVAYAISLVVHFWQCLRYKSWDVTALLPFCAATFTAGFAVRLYSAFNYSHNNAFIATQFLIYATAPLLELANFHILGRILYFVPYLTPIHPGRVLSTFLMLSVVVEVLNALGVAQGIVASLVRDRTPAVEARIAEGQALMKAALVLQLSFAACFVALAAFFQRRCLRHGIRSVKVHGPLAAVYASMGFITVRTVYRTVEHFTFDELTSHRARTVAEIPVVVRYEWFFYVFEAALMFVAVAVFNVFHPRRWLPLNKRTYLAQDGATELDGPGWNDERPFIVTLCDPFNLAGLFSRTPKQDGRKFWENNGFELKKSAGGGVEGGVSQ